MLSDANVLTRAWPAFILLIIVESICLLREQNGAEQKKNILASLGIGAVAVVTNFLMQGVIAFTYISMYDYRVFTLPAGSWWAWTICFFADDLTYYWFHRLSHQVRFLWASHAVHHSSETYTLASAIRIPWTSNITGSFLFWAWMPLAGIEPGMLIFMKSFSVIYQFWLHTETICKMPGWFEKIFNTPSHHRVHHACNLKYLDKNHGGTLILWDKLFGTYEEEEEKPKYGLTKKIRSFNPFVIALHEWANMINDLKKARETGDYLNYIFKAPGWSHDNSTKTTLQLRKENNEQSD